MSEKMADGSWPVIRFSIRCYRCDNHLEGYEDVANADKVDELLDKMKMQFRHHVENDCYVEHGHPKKLGDENLPKRLGGDPKAKRKK